MADAVFSPQVSPLIIRDQGNKNGEHFDLDGLYLMTLEGFDHASQVLQHAMAAPGFFLARSGVVQKEYHPDNRPLHRHGCLELMYVISGEVTQYVEDHFRVYGPGDCCILNKNTRHVEAYSSNFEAGFLMLSDAFLLDVIGHDLRFEGFHNRGEADTPLYQQLRRLLDEGGAFHKEYLEFLLRPDACDARDRAENLLTKILMETKEGKPGFVSVVSGYLARFLGLLADEKLYEIRQVDMQGTREDYIFNSVRRYLHASHGRVDYGELENRMHYTGDYLNRIIRRKCGMSLVELGRSISLEEAAALLVQTDQTVAEIMHLLGYSNRTYFYRIFQEKYGVTPREYRLQNRG